MWLRVSVARPDTAQMLQVGMYALFAAEIYAWFVVGALSIHTVENTQSGQRNLEMSMRCQCRHPPLQLLMMVTINVVTGICCQGVLFFVQGKLLDGASQYQGTRSEQES